MRIAAIALAAVASLALDVGVFIYWLSNAFACLDSCPSGPDYTAQWMNVITTTLGPGTALSLAATVVGLAALRIRPGSVGFVVTLVTPIAVAIGVALIMQFVAGGFTPIAAQSGDPTFIPTSSAWITGASIASLPLAVWPLVTFLTLLVSNRAKAAVLPAP